jgi:hypothetical protein
VLIAKIKQGKAEREQTLTQFLSQQAGLSGAALEKAKVAMLRAELGFLQRLDGVYRKRDADALARFDAELFAAVEPYHGLEIDVGGTIDAVDGEPADSAELEHLRKENKRLSDELTITMETMSRMLNEYSTMFAGADAGGTAPIGAAAASVAGAAGAAVAATGSDDAVSEDAMRAVSDVEESAAAPDIVDSLDAELPGEIEPVADDQEAAVLFDDIEVAPGEAEADVETGEAEATAVDGDELAGSEIEITADVEDEAETLEDAESLFDIDIDVDQKIADVPDETAVDIDSSPVEVEDPVAEILRQAQSQEESARGIADDFDLDGEVGTGEELIEVGTAEVIASDADDPLDAIDLEDIDDLFDAPDALDKDDSRAISGNSSVG